MSEEYTNRPPVPTSKIPDIMRIPECCINSIEHPDKPCEHVINIENKQKKVNIGL